MNADRRSQNYSKFPLDEGACAVTLLRIIVVLGTLAILIGFTSKANAQCNTDYGAGSTTGNVNFGTNINWSKPNETDLSDDIYARTKLEVGDTSKFLEMSDFGLSVPSGAQITGIEVMVEKKQQTISTINDASVRLTLNGNPVGNDKAQVGVAWSTSDAVTTYGGSVDDWGTGITPQDVNNNTFGFLISATRVGPPFGTTNVFHAFIDRIALRVYYLGNGGCTLQEKFLSFSAKDNGEFVTLSWASEAPSGSVFNIERGADENSLQNIATSFAEENDEIAVYDYRDYQTAESELYYRIEMIYPTGETYRTPVLNVRSTASAENKMMLGPNPTTAHFKVRLEDVGDIREVILTDLRGKVLRQPDYDSFAQGDVKELYFNIGQQAPGYYFLMVRTDEGKFSEKLVLR